MIKTTHMTVTRDEIIKILERKFNVNIKMGADVLDKTSYAFEVEECLK